MSAENALVSALLPVKNYHDRHLKKAVGSLLAQSSPDWRLLVIVEPEDVQTFQNILQTELQDHRVNIVENSGRKLAGALNSGMRQAQTEFVGILLGDDMWSNDAVAVLSRNIREHPDVDFFHSSRRYIDENDQPISSIYHSRESFALEEFLSTSPVKHLLCWRREKALSFGGMDETLNSVGPDDYDFPWSMAEHGAVFRSIKDCLYLYREHLDSYRLTTHLPLSVHTRELKRIMKKHGAPSSVIRNKVSAAKSSYLKQCLYRSRFDQWLKGKLRYNLRKLWWRPDYH
jgi:glycosyltransferase involved in cell wall biosynthesis